MNPTTEPITPNFNQILTLVKQLPYPQKLQLSQELAKELACQKLDELLTVFKTDELSIETIDQEVEAIRSEIYASEFSRVC